MTIQLEFESLLKKALTDWPKVLDVSVLQQVTPDLSRYTVKDLGLLSDTIDEKFIGKENEIIWRDLHNAIYEVIHEAAKVVLIVELKSIRKEAVRAVFEKRLQRAASRSDLNWQPTDFVLVESYFKQNRGVEPTRKTE